MTDGPERIWARTKKFSLTQGHVTERGESREWCENYATPEIAKICKATEYVRADLYATQAERIAELEAENGKLHAVINGACVWTDGEPDRVHRTEWFIAKSIRGERCVLRALHDDHSYDYETADGTYIMAKNIASWMQFPDSNFIPFADHIAALKGPTHDG